MVSNTVRQIQSNTIRHVSQDGRGIFGENCNGDCMRFRTDLAVNAKSCVTVTNI